MILHSNIDLKQNTAHRGFKFFSAGVCNHGALVSPGSEAGERFTSKTFGGVSVSVMGWKSGFLPKELTQRHCRA